jgi:hypothetical protein
MQELQIDGPGEGNMRLKTILTRFGAGMDQDDYINLHVNKACMYAVEGNLKSEIAPHDGHHVTVDNAPEPNSDLNDPND